MSAAATASRDASDEQADRRQRQEVNPHRASRRAGARWTAHEIGKDDEIAIERDDQRILVGLDLSMPTIKTPTGQWRCRQRDGLAGVIGRQLRGDDDVAVAA